MKYAFKVLLITFFFLPGIGICGITDTPLPVFSDGSKAKLIYSVPGVIANRAGMATSFHCTNIDKKPVTIGVEIFQWNGIVQNDVSLNQGVITDILPGNTRTFSTQNTVVFFDDNIILGGQSIFQGSARIIATSNKIICSAMQVSETDPPAAMVALPVLKGKSQKGM